MRWWRIRRKMEEVFEEEVRIEARRTEVEEMI